MWWALLLLSRLTTALGGWASFPIHTEGYAVINELLTAAEVEWAEGLISDAINRNQAFDDGPAGVKFPDAAMHAEFKPLLDLLLGRPRLHAHLRSAFQEKPFHFANMSDIQVNSSIPWHRDLCHKKNRQFQRLDPWATGPNSERYAMFRLILYLQDHTAEDDEGLSLVAGSHLARPQGCSCGLAEKQWRVERQCEAPPPPSRENREHASYKISTRAGDAVLFDMRAIHKGGHRTVFPKAKARMAIQLTFGADNIFTAEWSHGDERRRAAWYTANEPKKPAASAPPPAEAGREAGAETDVTWDASAHDWGAQQVLLHALQARDGSSSTTLGQDGRCLRKIAAAGHAMIGAAAAQDLLVRPASGWKARCAAFGHRSSINTTIPGLENVVGTGRLSVDSWGSPITSRVRTLPYCANQAQAAELAAWAAATAPTGNRPLDSSAWGGNRSCAVVGSDSTLRGSGLGKAIDAYDEIIRFNCAPTAGHETDVGSRTTLRVVRGIALTCTSRHGVAYECGAREARLTGGCAEIFAKESGVRPSEFAPHSSLTGGNTERTQLAVMATLPSDLCWIEAALAALGSVGLAARPTRTDSSTRAELRCPPQRQAAAALAPQRTSGNGGSERHHPLLLAENIAIVSPTAWVLSQRAVAAARDTLDGDDDCAAFREQVRPAPDGSLGLLPTSGAVGAMLARARCSSVSIFGMSRPGSSAPLSKLKGKNNSDNSLGV